LCIYVQEMKWNPRCMIPRYLCLLLVCRSIAAML
jgi:hypothetical protein